MSKKNLIILFIIFVVLAILASSSWWKTEKGVIEDKEIDLTGFTSTNVERISITHRGEEQKDIYKENGIWKINGFDASKKEIEDFFKTLKHMKIKSLASRNPENHKNFDTTEEDGYVVSFIRGGDRTDTFIIGKGGPEYSSFYIKKKGSNNVYLVSGLLRTKLQRSVDMWREKEDETNPPKSKDSGS